MLLIGGSFLKCSLSLFISLFLDIVYCFILGLYILFYAAIGAKIMTFNCHKRVKYQENKHFPFIAVTQIVLSSL